MWIGLQRTSDFGHAWRLFGPEADSKAGAPVDPEVAARPTPRPASKSPKTSPESHGEATASSRS
jgi:hypothetical protein